MLILGPWAPGGGPKGSHGSLPRDPRGGLPRGFQVGAQGSQGELPQGIPGGLKDPNGHQGPQWASRTPGPQGRYASRTRAHGPPQGPGPGTLPQGLNGLGQGIPPQGPKGLHVLALGPGPRAQLGLKSPGLGSEPRAPKGLTGMGSLWGHTGLAGP